MVHKACVDEMDHGDPVETLGVESRQTDIESIIERQSKESGTPGGKKTAPRTSTSKALRKAENVPC